MAVAVANLTTNQVYALARNAGFNAGEAVTATAIAMAESSGNPAAVGDVNLQTAKWGPSVGLWQIRTIKAEQGKGTIRDYAWLMASPVNQAQAAYQIRSGQGWSAWTMFTNGSYSSNVTAVEKSVGVQASSGGDQWWKKLFILTPSGLTALATGAAIGGAQSGATPGQIADATGEAVKGIAQDAIPGGDVLGKLSTLLDTVNSGEFWKRLGIGVGGAVVILLAVLLMVWAAKGSVIRSTVGSVVSGATKGK